MGAGRWGRDREAVFLSACLCTQYFYLGTETLVIIPACREGDWITWESRRFFTINLFVTWEFFNNKNVLSIQKLNLLKQAYLCI